MAERHYKRITAEDLPDTIQYREGFFVNARDQSLFYLTAFPRSIQQSKLRGIVFFVHGIGDHSGRYYALFRSLCSWGFGVVAYDLVSNGRSDYEEAQLRAHSRSFQYFIDDTNAMLSMIKQEKLPSILAQQVDPNYSPPLIYMGLSFGTLVGVHVILSSVHKFDAVVLLATAISADWTPLLRFLATLSSIFTKLIPRMHIVHAFDNDDISRNKGFVKDIEKDPLMTLGDLTARMAEQTLRAMRALETDPRIADPENPFSRIPVLSIMGSEDHITNVSAGKEFFERLACQDKEFKVFDGLFHGILEEPEKEQVYQFLQKWMQSRFT